MTINKFELIHGNSIEFLKTIKQNSIDMILLDPPYKIASRGGYTSAGGMMTNKLVQKGKVFKNNNISINDWLPLIYSVLKESSHCYIFTNNKNITNFLNVINNSDFHFIKNLIWVKNNKIMSQAYMSQFEYILFLRKGKFTKINNCGTSDVLCFDNPINKLHPTEKPVELLETLISNSTSKNSIVLDCFMGCGSTGIACKKLNRNFIGVEIDKKYYNIAKERIYQYDNTVKPDNEFYNFHSLEDY